MRMLTMPRLGQTMDRGTVLRHGVAAGEPFAEGDVLYVVETEKVEVDVEAKAPGRVLRWLAGGGDELDVGGAVAVVADPTEVPDEDEVAAFLGLQGHGDVGAGAGATPGAPLPKGGGGAAVAPSGRVRAVPKARAMAEQHGADLAAIAAGVGDRAVTPADVEAYLAQQVTPTLPARVAASEPPPRADDGLVPLVGPRRAMARQMATSWSTIPHFVEAVLVDASAVLASREAARSPGVRPPTITAYLAAALAAACVELPMLHATLVDEALRHHADVNMNVAVDTTQGLVAPVIHGIQSLSLAEIAARLDDLASRARNRALGIDDVQGGNITLSNLGNFGIDTGTPVIQPGQTALLFAGAIVPRAVVIEGEVVARSTMWLSLACDHRVVDGATAARALTTVKRVLEA